MAVGAPPRRATVHIRVDWTPAIATIPTHFHYNDAPPAKDGHRHSYSARALRCACGHAAPMPILRFDKALKQHLAMMGVAYRHNLDLDYPPEIDVEEPWPHHRPLPG